MIQLTLLTIFQTIQIPSLIRMVIGITLMKEVTKRVEISNIITKEKNPGRLIWPMKRLEFKSRITTTHITPMSHRISLMMVSMPKIKMMMMTRMMVA
jgi:hypothetical protein